MRDLPFLSKPERLLEPASRAIRRGDPRQLDAVIKRLRALWSADLASTTTGDDRSIARGMTMALEAVLGFALARSAGDARHALVESRKHALPILHALGLNARKVRQALPREEVSSAPGEESSMSVTELAREIGAEPQNLGELLDSMVDCELIATKTRGSSRRVWITHEGLSMLESTQPGWQVTSFPVEPDVDATMYQSRPSA